MFTPTALRALLLVAGLTLPALAGQEGARTGEELVGGRGNWEAYFPFRLGDSWTYEWRADGPMASSGTAVRTRTFDGTSFVGEDVGYKLVSDDGAYHLYTFEDGVLAIHSSSEAGRLMYYDPPVVLAAPDMAVGRPVRVEHDGGARVWTATLTGLEDVDVPLGRLARCLTITLEMRGPDFSSRATHRFAPRLGLVAYEYELRDAASGRTLLAVTAGLKLARLAGRHVTGPADLDALPRRTPDRTDSGARELLRRALMKRYTWDAGFPGFRGAWELRETGAMPVTGRFEVRPDLTVQVEATDAAARAVMRNEISSFITQRKPVAFDETYGATAFARSATRPDGSTVVVAVGDPLATTYTIKGGEIVEVSRSMGRLSYTARELRTIATGDGRTITAEYDVIYTSNEDQSRIAVEHTVDAYEPRDGWWVPAGRRTERTEAGSPATVREIRFTNVR